MPNIGLPELVIVLVIALVVFGPKRLPEMGQKLGQALREFRSATSEIRSQVGVDDIADSVKDIKSSLSLTADGARSGAETVADPSAEGSPATGELVAGSTDVVDDAASGAGGEPAADAAVSDAPAEGALAGEPPETGLTTAGAAAVDQPSGSDEPLAAADGGEGGIEAFGSLKRGSASAVADGDESGIEAFGSLKRSSASASGRATTD
jgi:sec-independent protein translocase protein TatA